MSDYGIKISAEGSDVKTANSSDIVYSSKWSNFKIYGISSGTVNAGGVILDPYTSYVAIPVDFIPLIYSYVQDPNNSDRWYNAGGMSQILNTGYASAFIANNLITMSVLPFANGINKAWNFKIVVFMDKFSGDDASSPSTGNYGVKVSVDGADVKTCEDTQSSLSSKFSNLTVFESGTVSASGGAATISHDLGYCPICMVFMQEPYATSYYSQLPSWFQYSETAPDAGLANYYVTENSLNITYTEPENGNNVNFKYIIFNERFN